ncbi:MAG TPA: helix-turn-helix domain-containing protein [Candidatus Limnocylindria bacterium]|nr:helix-turn-helix domain-containing protein [Candidatus Limnocylindria bacterium]
MHPLVVIAQFVVAFLAIHPCIERTMVQPSDVQERILAIVDQHGHVTSSLVARTLQLPGRTVRYHLDVLIQHGLLEPIGEKRGRTYRRSIDNPSAVGGPVSRNAAILAEILEQGGRIDAAALRELVVRQGSDPRMVGSLHGRRLAHLRRDRQTGESVLTARGREIAEQHLFARRLARLPARGTPATG